MESRVGGYGLTSTRPICTELFLSLIIGVAHVFIYLFSQFPNPVSRDGWVIVIAQVLFVQCRQVGMGWEEEDVGDDRILKGFHGQDY